MAKMLRIKSCAQCGECRLGRTANAGIHPDCPLPDAPEPYSESNRPQEGDLVNANGNPAIVVYKNDGGGWWIYGPSDNRMVSPDELTLLCRPPQPDEEKPQ